MGRMVLKASIYVAESLRDVMNEQILGKAVENDFDIKVRTERMVNARLLRKVFLMNLEVHSDGRQVWHATPTYRKESGCEYE